MNKSNQKTLREAFKFKIDGELKQFSSLQELAPYYKNTTNNCLGKIKTLSAWDASRRYKGEDDTKSDPPPVTPYQSVVPHIMVPGILEFGGLYSQIKRIQDSGLPIQDFTNTYLYDDIVENHTPNLFADLTEKEVLDLFKKTDPRLLGLAGDILHYYHNGRIHLARNFDVNPRPNMFSGYESNGMLAAYNVAKYYEHHPFSNKLIKDMIKWSRTEGPQRLDIPTRQLLELRILEETSIRVREGFNLGERISRQ